MNPADENANQSNPSEPDLKIEDLPVEASAQEDEKVKGGTPRQITMIQDM
jgi:hypothetical protein